MPKEKLKIYSSMEELNTHVINCYKCDRLVAYREAVPAKKNYEEDLYWRKPLPGFGDPNAWLLLVGLAPSPHGGNRTGRIFTGDETGKFLMHCLYLSGLANQPTSQFADDGLKLKGCYMTAAVKCVPPLHKPAPVEIRNCSGYLYNEIYHLKNLKSILALGRLAFDAIVRYMREKGVVKSSLKFSHGVKYEYENFPTLYGSYHPTPRNVNTGTLTEKMLCDLLQTIQKNK